MSTDPSPPESRQTWRGSCGCAVRCRRTLSFDAVRNVVANGPGLPGEKHIEGTHDVNINDIVPAALGGTAAAGINCHTRAGERCVVMEANAMESRYHQANDPDDSSLYCFPRLHDGNGLGDGRCDIHLAKLRESEAKVEAGTSTWKMALTTASPGLVLAFLHYTDAGDHLGAHRNQCP